MPNFDEKAWLKRVFASYTKKKGTSKSKALERLKRDTVAIKQITRVIGWVTKKNVVVEFGTVAESGFYIPVERLIKIDNKLTVERQLHLLLHECGHLLIGPTPDDDHRFGLGYSQTEPAMVQTFAHRCSVIDEEYEAWARGWKLAQRLKLKIDKKRYEKTKHDMLKFYFRWALEFFDE